MSDFIIFKCPWNFPSLGVLRNPFALLSWLNTSELQICHGSRSTSLATLSQLFSFSLAFCMILQTVFFWKSVMGLQHEWCKIRKSYNTFWKQHQHDKSRASQLSFPLCSYSPTDIIVIFVRIFQSVFSFPAVCLLPFGWSVCRTLYCYLRVPSFTRCGVLECVRVFLFLCCRGHHLFLKHPDLSRGVELKHTHTHRVIR